MADVARAMGVSTGLPLQLRREQGGALPLARRARRRRRRRSRRRPRLPIPTPPPGATEARAARRSSPRASRLPPSTPRSRAAASATRAPSCDGIVRELYERVEQSRGPMRRDRAIRARPARALRDLLRRRAPRALRALARYVAKRAKSGHFRERRRRRSSPRASSSSRSSCFGAPPLRRPRPRACCPTPTRCARKCCAGSSRASCPSEPTKETP